MIPRAGSCRIGAPGRCALAVFLVTVVSVAGLASGRSEEAPRIVIEHGGGQVISPNGDGVQDALAVSVARRDADGRPIVAVELSVYGGEGPLAGELVARRRVEAPGPDGVLARLPFVGPSAGLLPLGLEWNGTFSGSPAGSDRGRVPDGEYLYQVTAFDDRRSSASTAPLVVVVDTEPPRTGTITAESGIFSPNGDGVRDTITVGLSGSSERAWSALVLDADGEPVREFTFADAAPRPVTWDGTDESGEPLPDGTYRLVLSGTDAAGNRAVGTPFEITLSRRAGEVRLVSTTPVVSPNGDGVLDRAALAVELDEAQRIASWRLLVAEPDSNDPGGTFVAGSGGGAPSTSITFAALGVGGEPLPDGAYRVSLEATYRNGSVVRSQPVTIEVDTRAPTGVLTAGTLPEPAAPGEPLVFGAGARARLRISAELDAGEWTALVTRDGETERVGLERIGLTGREPSFVWDGSLPDGSAAPDGVYELALVATDEAGNAGATNTLRVVRDTSAGRARLSVDRRAFSPDGDGVLDAVSFVVELGRRTGIEGVRLAIADASGRRVRTESSSTAFGAFVWDGRSDAGVEVPDGTYRARLEVAWRNGAQAVAASAPVVVDTRPPRVEHLSLPYRLFSPDGDGERDTVRIAQATSPEDVWVGRIRGREGAVVLERRWRGEATDFVWDGRGAAGRRVADGDYTYELCATDAAGNAGCADVALVIDTTSLPVSRQPPVLSLSAAPDPFTPDGDGADDVLTFEIDVESPNELDSWTLAIADGFGRELRTLAGEGEPPPRVEWDGRSLTGELVQSAHDYVATLRVIDVHGNAGQADARVRVGILVMQEGLVLRIRIPSISFAPNEADLFAVPEPELRRNLETLRGLAEVLRRYPYREILIEGHAAHDDWETGPEKEREQRDELVPLSAARAEEVRRALVILGIEEQRMTTVGVGGARPVVPHSDREGIWKNRRVEFILKQR